MTAPSDHDLLIGHSIKIDALCNLVKAIDHRIGDYTDKLDERCGRTHTTISDTHKDIFDKMDAKTDGITFRWLTGLLILVMLGLAGVTSTCMMSAGTNRDAIARLEKSMESWHP